MVCFMSLQLNHCVKITKQIMFWFDSILFPVWPNKYVYAYASYFVIFWLLCYLHVQQRVQTKLQKAVKSIISGAIIFRENISCHATIFAIWTFHLSTTTLMITVIYCCHRDMSRLFEMFYTFKFGDQIFLSGLSSNRRSSEVYNK